MPTQPYQFRLPNIVTEPHDAISIDGLIREIQKDFSVSVCIFRDESVEKTSYVYLLCDAVRLKKHAAVKEICNALKNNNILLSEVGSVEKSFPGFWEEMRKLGIVAEECF